VAEQGTFNPPVVGSNPTGPSSDLRSKWLVPQTQDGRPTGQLLAMVLPISATRSKDGVHLSCGLALERRNDVAVRVHRQADLRMT
jgi:hypothetical protein